MSAVEGVTVLYQGELPAELKGIAPPARDQGDRVEAL
jgi:hypothetical protein